MDDEKWIREKTIEFTAKITQVETQLNLLNDGLKETKKELSQDIQNAVTNRIDDMMKIIDGQLKTQNRILEIQGRQSEQISAIQKTLAETQSVRDIVSRNTEKLKSYDERLDRIEANQRSEDDIKKSRYAGIWSAVVAIIGAIATVITALVGKI